MSVVVNTAAQSMEGKKNKQGSKKKKKKKHKLMYVGL